MCTTNGNPAPAAISARDPWRCSTRTATTEHAPRSTAASRHRRSTSEPTTSRGAAEERLAAAYRHPVARLARGSRAADATSRTASSTPPAGSCTTSVAPSYRSSNTNSGWPARRANSRTFASRGRGSQLSTVRVIRPAVAPATLGVVACGPTSRAERLDPDIVTLPRSPNAPDRAPGRPPGASHRQGADRDASGRLRPSDLAHGGGAGRAGGHRLVQARTRRNGTVESRLRCRSGDRGGALLPRRAGEQRVGQSRGGRYDDGESRGLRRRPRRR